MNHGIKTVIYPVKDLDKAKALFSQLLGAEPAMDQSYYVGFTIGDQEIGLDPNAPSEGMTGPAGYYHVDDIQASLKSVLDAGGQVQRPVNDVGGGKLIATVKDADGNWIGLIQMP